MTDARGLTTTTAYRTDVPKGAIDYEQDSASNTTTYGYDAATGRMTSIQRPGQKMQYFAYKATGELEKTWGDTPYPVKYDYDAYGRRTDMYTYAERDNTYDWTTAVWPNPSDDDADKTHWVYQETTGLLSTKTHAYGSGDPDTVEYTYTNDGRLLTRTWARGVVTEYDYYDDAGEPLTGELQSIDYGDNGVAEVRFAYNRLGGHSQVIDDVGTRTLTVNAVGQPDEERINVSGGGLYSKGEPNPGLTAARGRRSMSGSIRRLRWSPVIGGRSGESVREPTRAGAA